MNFSQRTLDFLFENRLHDDKAWFAEHKEEYRQKVLAPFGELLTELAPTMEKIDPSIICDPKKISRIYKDARYSHDSVFRDEVWYNFSRCVGSDVSPTFYIVIGRGKLEYGCGYYAAPAAAMQAMRDMIIADDPTALAALAAYKKQKIFKLNGDKFKRERYGEYSEEKRDWLNRRNIFLSYSTADKDIIFDPLLYKHIAGDFKKIVPIYRLLRNVEVESRPRTGKDKG